MNKAKEYLQEYNNIWQPRRYNLQYVAFNKKVSSQAKKQENTIHKKKKLIN